MPKMTESPQLGGWCVMYRRLTPPLGCGKALLVECGTAQDSAKHDSAEVPDGTDRIVNNVTSSSLNLSQSSADQLRSG